MSSRPEWFGTVELARDEDEYEAKFYGTTPPAVAYGDTIPEALHHLAETVATREVTP